MTQNFRRLLGATSLAAALATALAAPGAHAAILDFEGDDLTGLYFQGDSFSSHDFTLTALQGFGVVDIAQGLGAQAPIGDATQFYFAGNDAVLRVVRMDGALFSLSSFSAAFVPLDPPADQTTVIVATAVKADDSTVSVSWAFAGATNGRYAFSDYANAADFSALGAIKSVEFHACSIVGGAICTVPTQNNGQFAIDNISVSAVPEAGTTALLALGLFSLGLMRLSRRNAR